MALSIAAFKSTSKSLNNFLILSVSSLEMLASEVPKVTKAVSKGATYSTFLALIIC